MNKTTNTTRVSVSEYQTPASYKNIRPLPLPEPMPNTIAYEMEREKRLKTDLACRSNYEKYKKYHRQQGKVDYLPIKLDIEPVSRCNFKCKMCQVSGWHKGKRADDMRFSDFKKLIDKQLGLVEIKLTGMGEPLLAGNELFDMIRYAREKHIWVRSITNASLLHLRDNYRKFIDSGTNELQVSIDGTDKETFESIRVGSVFEQVVKNCQLLNNYCDKLSVERTKMWTTVQKANFHQLFDFVAFADHNGFKSLVFNYDLLDWGQKEWRQQNKQVSMAGYFDPELGWQLVDEGEKRSVKVSFWCIASKYAWSKPKHLCPWPFERAYVSSDQRVVPCCMVANPDVLEMGQASQSLAEVWQSQEYTSFRQDHIEGNIPSICKECYNQRG